MSEFIDLAELIDEMDDADRKMDLRIKLAVAAQMFAGGASKDQTVEALGGDLDADPLPYTESYRAALSLVPPGYSFSVGDMNENECSWACITDPDGNDYASENPVNPVLALCASGLRALAALS